MVRFVFVGVSVGVFSMWNGIHKWSNHRVDAVRPSSRVSYCMFVATFVKVLSVATAVGK